MANEILVSAHSDLVASEIVAKELEFLLARKPWMKDVCVFRGDTKDQQSDTLKTPQVKLDDVAASVAEGSAVSATTALTDASYSLTPARLAIKREVSDKFIHIMPNGMIDPERLAEFNHIAVMLGFDGLATAALANFTGSVGTSGAPLTVIQFQSAYQTLMQRNAAGQVGRMICVLHEKQFGDLQRDLLNYDQTVGRRQDAQDLIAMRGANYKGDFLGVEIWTSNQVIDANSAADHNGAMFIHGGLAYAQGSAKPVQWGGGRKLHTGGVIYTSFLNSVDEAELQMVTNGFFAVSVTEAAKGIGVITDHA